MPPGDAKRIRDYMVDLVEAARAAGRSEISFRSGDVHKALGLKNAYPNVCNILKDKRRQFQRQARVTLLEDKTTGPPSGMGGNLTCHYEIIGAASTATTAAAAASAQAACCPPDDGGVRERLARLEALVEGLVRDSDGAKADVRALNSRIDSLYTSGGE